jgi:glutamate--cysteine ligase
LQVFLEKLKSNPCILKAIQQGVEKEGLRVNSLKQASMKSHPENLGSKLTHPYITTDYSENLMEFISPVFNDCNDMFIFLRELFSFTYRNIDEDEVIWPWSMPSLLPENEMDIPVARYGSSNVGKLKTLYRVGLGHRYGKSMQSIAGVHYNFSLKEEFWKAFQESENDTQDLQEFINEKYFHLIRNYRRYSWLLIYLFGATPVVDESFLKGKKHDLTKLGKNSYGRAFATSLRMGGLGYTSNAQKEISVCYNHLNTYVKTLEQARLQTYPEYERIGLKDGDEFKQLNTNLLQIDNEFYSTIRPKRTARSRESALQALHRGGIEYLEVRLLDVDPFADAGLSREAVKFLHIFMLACLLTEAPIISDSECEEIDKNLLTVVNYGRDPEAKLICQGVEKKLIDCALEVFNKLEFIVPLLDQAYGSNIYSRVFDAQKLKIEKPELTPSAKVLAMVSEEESVLESIYELARDYKKIHVNITLPQELDEKWKKLTQDSFEDQKKIEEADQLSFEDFLAEYFENIKIKFEE